MPDYQNGKIYRLWSLEGDMIYVGSTCAPLYKRLYRHKKDWRHWKNGVNHNITSFKLFEAYDTVKIELIKEYPCGSKHQLEREEGKYIRELDCVNKIVAGRTPKEYYEENRESILEKKKDYHSRNKEQIAQRHKAYRESNREQINEWHRANWIKNKDNIKRRQRVKITCECGRVVRNSDISRHRRTNIHKQLMSSK